MTDPDYEHDSLPQAITWKSALAVAIATSALFMVFYNGSAWITDQRSDVGTWRYDWEKIIPFVPIMIVPYMSIDAFFFVAPFFCHDRKELKVLSWRLGAVVVLASLFYLVCPLHLAVDRPKNVPGIWGAIYNWFTALDHRPYNLCPSMHIALRTVLAAHYGKHSRGFWRIGMNVWFFLIGCSTLLLYQHHVIDVVGGFVLAALVMYAIDGLPWRLPKVGGLKFGILYGVAAAFFVGLVVVEPKLGWITLWPAVACGFVSFGYLFAGPAIYRRHKGEIRWPARFVLGPVLFAQWLSWKHYGRQASPMNHVVDGVWIGRHLDEVTATEVVQSGEIGAVVDVCNAFNEPEVLCAIPRLEIPVLDLTAPTESQLNAAVDFIESHRQQGVFVHCKAGYSRSAAIVATWLCRTGRAKDMNSAFEILRAVRPQIVIRPEIRVLTP